FSVYVITRARFADAENKPRIVRRQIASPAHSHAAALEISRLVSDASANGIGVGFLSNQVQAEAVISDCCRIFHEHRRAIVNGDHDIDGAVIVEITKCQSACRQMLGEQWTALGTDV